MELRHPTAITVRDRAGVQQQRSMVEVVRSLAELDVRPFKVLSISLDTQWRDEQQRQRVRLFMKEQARKLRAQIGNGVADEVNEALLADIARAEEIIEDRIRSQVPAGGLALFLCGARGIDIEVAMQDPLPQRFLAASYPMLRSLLEGLREPGRAVVAVVDSESTRIYRLTGDGPDLVGGVDRDVPRRHKRGGWSQLRYQHHRAEELDKHHREAATLLGQQFDAEGHLLILIGGRQESVSNLESHLPERIRRRVTRVDGLDPSMSEERIASAIDDALDDILFEEDVERIRAIEDLAAQGRGATDLQSVINALNEQRVARLCITEQLCGDGWICGSCSTIGDGNVATCGECSKPVDHVELGEALVRRAVLQGAEVECMDGQTGIDRLGGVAAELRYPTIH